MTPSLSVCEARDNNNNRSTIIDPNEDVEDIHGMLYTTKHYRKRRALHVIDNGISGKLCCFNDYNRTVKLSPKAITVGYNTPNRSGINVICSQASHRIQYNNQDDCIGAIQTRWHSAPLIKVSRFTCICLAKLGPLFRHYIVNSLSDIARVIWHYHLLGDSLRWNFGLRNVLETDLTLHGT